MNHYETNIIISPTLEKKQIKDLIGELVNKIKKEKGKIIHQSQQDMRKLAYPIQKHEQGVYQTIEFQANSHFVDQIETFYRRKENIIRFMTHRLDNNGIDYNKSKREEKKKEVTALKDREKNEITNQKEAISKDKKITESSREVSVKESSKEEINKIEKKEDVSLESNPEKKEIITAKEEKNQEQKEEVKKKS